MTQFRRRKEPTDLQKALKLNLAGPEPRRGKERTAVTFRGKGAMHERERQRERGRERERERVGRAGLGQRETEEERGQERQRRQDANL